MSGVRQVSPLPGRVERGKAMNPKAYRLPQSVLPRRYDIALDARLGVTEIHGRVVIQLELVESCAAIELHARGLRGSEATLAVQGRMLPSAATPVPDPELPL